MGMTPSPVVPARPGASPARPIIECAGLHKSYPSADPRSPAVEVLKGVDLKLYRSRITTIFGASGSGKSTLLNVLGGLDRPTRGSVLWESQDFYSMKEDAQALERGRLIGFVFQFHHLLNEFSALENVMIPSLIMKQPAARAEARAKELLDSVGLAERFHHRPPALSGGEQQRVAVARALINDPALVLADEPSGNLDTQNSVRLNAVIRKLHAERGQSFLIVTHNSALAEGSDSTYVMADGVLNGEK